MQKLFQISLLLIFILSFVGSFIFLDIMHIQNQSKVHKGLSEGKLELQLIYLVFNKEEFQALEWEHEKEFKWKGDMYDVSAIDQNENNTGIWCWKDEKDTKIDAQQDALLLLGLLNHPENDTGAVQTSQIKILLDVPVIACSVILPRYQSKTVVPQKSPLHAIFTPAPPLPPPQTCSIS